MDNKIRDVSIVCESCGISKSVATIHKTKVDNVYHHLCSKHYQVFRKFGRLKSVREEKRDRVCDVCGVDNYSSEINTTNRFGGVKNLCKKHYELLSKYGKIVDRKENDVIESENHIDIVVYENDNSEKCVVKFSKKHKERVLKHNWYATGSPIYAHTYINKKRVSLHNYIGEILFGEYDMKKVTIDHINRNTIDNTDENLRLASQTVQNINQKIRTDNTSGVKGVSFSRIHEKWRARINYGSVVKEVVCDSFQDAVELRKKWEDERDEVLGL